MVEDLEVGEITTKAFIEYFLSTKHYAKTFIECFLSTKHYTKYSPTPLRYETFGIIPFDESESRFKWVNAFPTTTKLMNGGWL